MRSKRRCQRLDMNGKRCGKMALPCPVRYHGSHEIYDFRETDVSWVDAYLCNEHAQSVAGRNIESRRRKEGKADAR